MKAYKYHPSLNLSAKIHSYEKLEYVSQKNHTEAFQEYIRQGELKIANIRKEEARAKKEKARREQINSNNSSIFGDIIGVIAQTAQVMNANNGYQSSSLDQLIAQSKRDAADIVRQHNSSTNKTSNDEYNRGVERSNAYKASLNTVNQTQTTRKPTPRPTLTNNNERATPTRTAQESMNTQTSNQRIALAVTWKNSHGYWRGHGPVQLVSVGDKEESVILGLACGGKYNARYLEGFGKYRIHECSGRELKSYDNDIAKKYNLPGKFHTW